MYCKGPLTELQSAPLEPVDCLRDFGDARAGIVMLVLTALIFCPVVSSGSEKPVSVADDKAPALGDHRLFVDQSQRRRLDSKNARESAPEEVAAPVVKPETVTPVVKAIRPRVKKPSVQSANRFILNGIVRKSNGSVDVWVNGTEVTSVSDVTVIQVDTTGTVVLRIRGKQYSLYPGQAVYAGGSVAAPSDLASVKSR